MTGYIWHTFNARANFRPDKLRGAAVCGQHFLPEDVLLPPVLEALQKTTPVDPSPGPDFIPYAFLVSSRMTKQRTRRHAAIIIVDLAMVFPSLPFILVSLEVIR
jgi:hypothetical protein